MANSSNNPDSDDESAGSRLFGKVGMAIVVEVLAGIVIGLFALDFGGEDTTIYEPPTTPEPTYEPPITEDTTWDYTPEETEETTEPVPSVGDCFWNLGTTEYFELEPSDCVAGAFETVKVLSEDGDCNGVPRAGFGPAYGGHVLCLSYLHPLGDAYFAQPDDCVTLAGDGTLQITDCYAGVFRVVQTLWGDSSSDQCSEWEYYNDAWDFTGYIPEQDLRLCLRMEYPDAMGFARKDNCLYASGSEGDMVFEFADCSAANAVVVGHTPDYDDPDFCNGYGWATWQSGTFPEYSYTVCWAWL